jgi:DNA-binding winged helix-turn-helix (wHTH) protein
MAANAFCRRCGAEIVTANLMDVDPGIDRAHFSLILIDGRHRQLSPSEWALFAMLYERHGRVVSPHEIGAATGIPISALREHVYRLRPLLTKTRFQLLTHRAQGFELIVRSNR